MTSPCPTVRAAFRAELLALAKTDPRVYCLDSDMGGLKDTFGSELPDRYVDVGVAEAVMVGMAAALAVSGAIPFVNTMAAFASLRAVEFVKVDVADAALPVKIVATHGGLAGAHLGPTHHCLVDLAVMRALPNMTVVTPADPASAASFVQQVIDVDGPVYVRLGRDEHGTVYDHQRPAPRIGSAGVLRPGNDVALLACGPLPVTYALRAAAELAHSGVDARVIDMHTLAPLDVDTIIAAATETHGLVTVEEHGMVGGLFAATAECVARYCPCKVEPVAASREPAQVVGSQEWLLDRAGVNVSSIVEHAVLVLDCE